MAPARACAYAVIRRVFEQGAYADRALHAEAAGLGARDRSLATALAYGVVQRRATLDHVAAALSSRPPERLDPPVLAAVRLGLLQLLFLDGIAEHAAVNESVELAKRGARSAGGLVNAVLRRATREGRGIVERLEDTTPAGAAVKHSVPSWLAELWFAELGPADARALLAVVNRPAEAALRVNALLATPDSVLERLPVAARPAPGLPEGLVLEGPFDAHGSELFAAGAIMPQSRGSMLVSRELAPEPGERILDLCAAPGAKTTHMAALLDGCGSLRAVERNPRRADGLRRTVARMGAEIVTVAQDDATAPAPAPGYDRVLVDPPCSGLGTLQSRPDLRWRAAPERIAELADLQSAILAAGARATRSGGTLVYSVCTISRAEGEGVIERLLDRQPGWTLERRLQTRPDVDGTDGFFVARLRRD